MGKNKLTDDNIATVGINKKEDLYNNDEAIAQARTSIKDKACALRQFSSWFSVSKDPYKQTAVARPK